ncbi:unnamed protein product, partial [Oikopleura dioica]
MSEVSSLGFITNSERDFSNATKTVADCKCAEGFVGDPSSYIPCEDKNECDVKNGGCSHICMNTSSGYFCSCPSGLRLQRDRRYCEPQLTASRPRGRYRPAFRPYTYSLSNNVNPNGYCNSFIFHPLTVPDNGRIIGPTSCVKPDYGRAFLGVNCRFMCSPNFSMIGASSTTCGMNGWSTRAPRCIKAECPGLAPKVGQEIAPLHCTAGGILPGAKCLMLCHKNYIFEDGTREKNVQCQSDGSWDKSQEDCVSTKVSITCPADVHEHLPPDDAIAWLQFDIKSATEPTTAHPRIRKNGHSYEYGFDLGVTEISFSTQNRFTGELASCSFFVDVVDDTPPISKNCQKGVMHHFDPDRQIFYDPKFEDNTGVMRIDV